MRGVGAWVALVLALGLAPPALAARAPESFATVIRDLRFEPQEHALYMPFMGPRPPVVTVSTLGRSLVLDLPRVGFPYAEFFSQVERSPLIRAYVAAYDPEIRGVHLVIEGQMPLRAEADASYRGNELRFILSPRDPASYPNWTRPGKVIQRLAVSPLGGEPPRLFTLTSQQLGWTLPAPRLLAQLGPTSEQYAPELVAANDPAAMRFGLGWEPGWGEYGFPMYLGRGAYRLADPDYQDVTHLRTDTRLRAAVTRRYEVGELVADTGVGYDLEYLQVDHSSVPATPGFLLAGYQVYHGPALLQTVTGPVWGPVRAGLELSWTPFVLAHVEGVTMPWLTRLRIEPRIYLWNGGRVTLGGFYERTIGASFNREASGLTVGFSFVDF